MSSSNHTEENEITVIDEASQEEEASPLPPQKTAKTMDEAFSVETMLPHTQDTAPGWIEMAQEDGQMVNAIRSSLSYILQERIGTGGMGEVYKAILRTHLGTSETVALKRVKKNLLQQGAHTYSTQAIQSHFIKETAIISELNGHPNIVGFRGADFLLDQYAQISDLFFVMEYIDGFDLKGLMALHNMDRKNVLRGNAITLPWEICGFIVFRIANALDFAHTFNFSTGHRGIVHLDLSPGNILIHASLGLIKLSDFGVAASMDDLFSDHYSLVGKPSYMSPEMVIGGKVNESSDLYSLGVIMYEMSTGICPNAIKDIQKKSMTEIRDDLMRLHEAPLVPPHKMVRGFNSTLSEIIMTLMDEDPESRYSSAGRLREIVGHAVYDKGFGPTDNSFARYINKMRLAHFHTHDKNLDRNPHMDQYMQYIASEQTPILLYKDAKERLREGNNPCRLIY
ncbi:serine/threonine protein kinase [Magnetococcales bacterium HHB-1]